MPPTVDESRGRPAGLAYRLLGPSWRSESPPVVLVHGAGRGVDVLQTTFAPLAEWLGVPLLLPVFARPGFRSYQRLAGRAGRYAASDALTSLLQELGWAEQPVDLVGFSGGAQFVHRFPLFTPVPIRRAVAASAGWYTRLDPATAFPYGLAPVGGREANAEALLRLSLRIMVGEHDVDGGPQLRTGPAVDGQGANRRERAERWHHHLESTAADRGMPGRASFEVLPGAAHSLRQAASVGGYVHRVASFLGDGGPPRRPR
jgi:pimeloyl-ACP methyl ester carboxylesterase